jgi:hypothetical protein
MELYLQPPIPYQPLYHSDRRAFVWKVLIKCTQITRKKSLRFLLPLQPQGICLFGIKLKNRRVLIFLRARQHQSATLAPHCVRCSAGVAHSRDTSHWSIYQQTTAVPSYKTPSSFEPRFESKFTRENHSNLVLNLILLAAGRRSSTHHPSRLLGSPPSFLFLLSSSPFTIHLGLSRPYPLLTGH